MVYTDKSLIVLDQKPLRMDAIQGLEAWHEKIEQLEIEIQKFHDTDFKLYSDWLRLIQNDLQEKNNLLIDKHKKLALFHNWVVFTAEEEDTNLPYAFFLMSEEEQRFQKGSKETKELIEKLRQERNEKIHARLKSETEDEFYDEDELRDELHDAMDDEDFYDHDGLEKEETAILSMREKFQKEIIFFESLTDKKIVKKMRQFNEGMDLISTCVYICGLCHRFDIIERIWALVPSKLKTHFNKDFKEQMGCTLDQHLINVKNDARSKFSTEGNDEDFDFKAHFENLFSKPKPETSPENLEVAKIFYRRIMLKIHPDKLSVDFVEAKKNWLDQLWKKIQIAYDKTDVQALQNLHLSVLVALKKYDELDYSDLKAGTHMLQGELTRLGKSHEDTLQHPAWGFSKLKSYKKLQKMAAEPYKKTSKEIKKAIKELEETHAALKELVDAAVDNSGTFRRKARPKPVQRRKKRSTAIERQQNLF